MTQSKKLDFSGQKIFCGIDVHKKSWKVCIRNEHFELKTFSQNPSAAELVHHLRTSYPAAEYRLVYEAGFCGFNAQREFAQEGIHCIIVNPADVPTSDKEKRRKSDTIDCRKLSRSLCDREVEAIYVPDIGQQEDRGVMRAYQQLIKDQTRCKNRIRGWLLFQGIQVPQEFDQYWPRNFIRWLKELSLSPSARISLDLLIRHLEQTREVVATALRHLRALSKEDRYKDPINRLRSIPGIGLISALLFVTEIGDINRFQRLDSLCDYVGLVPRVHGTGEHEKTLGLNGRGQKQLRETLMEASWTAVRQDPALTMAFAGYLKVMTKNKAIIRIARKLLNRIRYVMKNQTEYQKGVVQ